MRSATGAARIRSWRAAAGGGGPALGGDLAGLGYSMQGSPSLMRPWGSAAQFLSSCPGGHLAGTHAE